jgi:hypothetical protein
MKHPHSTPRGQEGPVPRDPENEAPLPEAPQPVDPVADPAIRERPQPDDAPEDPQLDPFEEGNFPI